MSIETCPFCKSTPVFPEAKDVFGTFYDAGCEECGIATLSLQIIDCFDRPRDHVHDSWDDNKIQYGIKYIEVARKQAIEQWNTRAEPDVRAMVNALLDEQMKETMKDMNK